jgi:hypothetical protein
MALRADGGIEFRGGCAVRANEFAADLKKIQQQSHDFGDLNE